MSSSDNGNSKQCKRIRVCSLGSRWPDAQPVAPDDKTLQHIFDVRGSMEDPYAQFGIKDGTDPAVEKFVLNQPGVLAFLKYATPAIMNAIHELRRSSEFETLEIYIRCRGGFQRSVAIAEHLICILRCDDVLKDAVEAQELVLSITHTTLERTRALKMTECAEK